MAAAHSVLVPICVYGKACKQPATESLINCSHSCHNKIHASCAINERCPFHDVKHPFESRVLAVSRVAPSAQPTSYTTLKELHYRTAIIKDQGKLDECTRAVKTVAGDDALVVASPGDGNCLMVAILRGYVGDGYPMSEGIERQGMLALRELLAQHIREHTWPHDQVAFPQTLEECIKDVATDGGWCGEVAMASFAHLCGVAIKLWRFTNDKKECGTIEPIMKTLINGGDGDDRRIIIHLLQTRTPRPGRPEHNSHWEVIIMKPPKVTSLRPFQLGSHEVRDGDWYLESVTDVNRTPPLHITPWCKVEFGGRGSKTTTARIVCAIQVKNGKGMPTCRVLSLVQKKDMMVSRSIKDILRVCDPPTADELKGIKARVEALLKPKQVIVDDKKDTPADNVKNRVRAKTPTKAAAPKRTSSSSGSSRGGGRGGSGKKRVRGHKPPSDDNISEEESEEQKPTKKPRKIGAKGGAKGALAGASAADSGKGNDKAAAAALSSLHTPPRNRTPQIASAAAAVQPQVDTPKTARIKQLEITIQTMMQNTSQPTAPPIPVSTMSMSLQAQPQIPQLHQLPSFLPSNSSSPFSPQQKAWNDLLYTFHWTFNNK